MDTAADVQNLNGKKFRLVLTLLMLIRPLQHQKIPLLS
jgi:hypothetical protein